MELTVWVLRFVGTATLACSGSCAPDSDKRTIRALDLNLQKLQTPMPASTLFPMQRVSPLHLFKPQNAHRHAELAGKPRRLKVFTLRCPPVGAAPRIM